MPSPLKKYAPQGCAAESRALAATGHSIRGIASYFGVSVDVYSRWKDEDPEIAEAVAQGKEQERQTLHNMLYRKAVEKQDTVAAHFLLKAKHGYREGDQSEQSNRVQITFALSGAMTPEQYKTIEAVANPKPTRFIENGD